MISAFTLAKTPFLHFGAGKISVLPSLIQRWGSNVLLVTGAQSFSTSTIGSEILRQLDELNLNVLRCSIPGEPSPAMINKAVEDFSSFNPDVVVAIGGGSVLDAGKAIAAMLPLRENVKTYLEEVGTKKHSGIKKPLIAVPTTAGTGSEATKNAVLSEMGENGFKRSLRHDQFVPDMAVVDPSLTVSCSPSTTAASGMDAFTQLLESFLSTAANPFTDALALEGLQRISRSLLQAYTQGDDLQARTDMALAAYLSGITLANAGLGLVHGFASSIGGNFAIPHGVICSSLMYAANKVTVRKLKASKNQFALAKYAQAGKLFHGVPNKPDEYYINFLLDLIQKWSAEMRIPRLAHYDVSAEHFSKIVSQTDNKFNPVKLDKEELTEVLEMV